MEYKKIVAIVRTGQLETVEHVLKGYGVKGISVTRVKGFGEYANFFERDWMCEHARVEIFIQASEVEAVVERIFDSAHTGNPGDGMVAVIPVETVYRIRTRRSATAEEV